MILLIDNYDSFSYNLYQLIGAVEPDIKVVRNDECTLALLQLCVEDTALVFCRIGQGGKFLFSVQDVCQHLALHRFPAFLNSAAE